MKRSMSITGRLALIVTISLMSFAPAMAGDHPAYLHALADLRSARWYISTHPGNWKQNEDETAVIRAIDAALSDIKQAAINDGKDLNDHPGAIDVSDRKGRLNKALELLRRTRADVNEHESNDFAKGLKARALASIDEAIKFTQKAIADKN